VITVPRDIVGRIFILALAGFVLREAAWPLRGKPITRWGFSTIQGNHARFVGVLLVLGAAALVWLGWIGFG